MLANLPSPSVDVPRRVEGTVQVPGSLAPFGHPSEGGKLSMDSLRCGAVYIARYQADALIDQGEASTTIESNINELNPST